VLGEMDDSRGYRVRNTEYASSSQAPALLMLAPDME
jgi:hypothetical protein